MASVKSRATRRIFLSGQGQGARSVERSDRQLLEIFTRRSGELSEQAFATLVHRHGPMVFGICRTLLADSNAAEDAFQATFLVLVRKADRISQPESLAPWLHGVALRTAQKARAFHRRRQMREEQLLQGGAREPVGDLGQVDMQLVRREEAELLHEEVTRLPEVYRAPLILCYLEGLTHVEAASRLRWPLGTLSVRLMRARKILQLRLARRGIAPAAGLLGLLLLPENASAALRPGTAESLAQAATEFAAGQGMESGLVSSHVSALVDEILGSLMVRALAPLVVATALAAGLAAACASTLAGEPSRPPVPAKVVMRAVGAPASRKTTAEAEKPPVEAAPGLPAAVDARALARVATGESEDLIDDADAAPVESPVAISDPPRPAPGAGAKAEKQVRLALGCESQGQTAERAKHLALAVLTDPNHPGARGLLGQVRSQGRWRRAEEVSEQTQKPTHELAALAEYNARREQLSPTANAHWNLALWCERQGLKAEATAHLIQVTRLAPGREGAWKRLGYQRFHGRWVGQDRLAAEREEFEAQRKADRLWASSLTRWREALENPKKRPAAEAALAEISDPRAANAVLAIFGNGDARDQGIAIQLLGQIDSRLSTRALALFAVGGANPVLQRVACEILARRDHREALGLLVSMLRDPEPNPKSVVYRFRMIPMGALGPASPGVTFIEGKKANFLLFYTVDESISGMLAAQNGFDYTGILRGLGSNPFVGPDFDRRVGMQNQQQLADLGARIEQVQQEARAEVEQTRAMIKRSNFQVIQRLKNISGVERDGNWESWKRWWVEERGYAYEPELFRTPPDTLIDQPKPTWIQNLHSSCFAAGTPVRTQNGLRPIESIRIGDQVLTQDGSTGALSFEPVVAAVSNPPDAMVRVELEQEVLLATGIHRFWKAGLGWVMARDLKPGDLVRVLAGVARVHRVSPLPSRPVFNLEVANHSSYFVGRQGALVHDNSPVDPVPHPFDEAAASPHPEEAGRDATPSL